MKRENSTITFESSGREVYADAGFIAIGPNHEIRQGSSGGMLEGAPYTYEELTELADFGIKCWEDFKTHHAKRMNVAGQAGFNPGSELPERPSIGEKKEESPPQDI